MNFAVAEGGYRYRPLKSGLKGWDCYGLQTCLIGAGYPLPQFGADGYFGKETHAAVTRFQQAAGLERDGIAGVITQRAVVLAVANPISDEAQLPKNLLKGMIEGESSYWCGAHTAQYSDGTRDWGLCMHHHLASAERSTLARASAQFLRFTQPLLLGYGVRVEGDHLWLRLVKAGWVVVVVKQSAAHTTLIRSRFLLPPLHQTAIDRHQFGVLALYPVPFFLGDVLDRLGL